MRLAGAILVTAIVSITFELTALAGPGLQTTAGKRTFLDLFVNTLDKGPALVVVRGLEILIEVEDLRKAGLRTVGGKRESIAGKAYVPLSSLAPEVSYSFDINELAVRLTVDPRLLGVSELAIRDIRPAGITYLANPSVFVNYGFDTQNFNGYSLFTEGGLSLDGDLLYSSLLLSPQQQVLRGLTNLTIDKPERLIRLVIGDAVADTGLLGGTVFLGGVGLSRDFGLNPYFIPYPMQRLSGLVTMPSLAD